MALAWGWIAHVGFPRSVGGLIGPERIDGRREGFKPDDAGKYGAIANGVFDEESRALVDLQGVELIGGRLCARGDLWGLGPGPQLGGIETGRRRGNGHRDIQAPDFFPFAHAGMGDGQADTVVSYAQVAGGF